VDNYKIDIPVLIIFFARPNVFSKVFEQVKIARPSKLFLYQDGARPNVASDAENIEKCRQIVKDIDWNCEVHTFYQEKNVGCDPSEFIAQKWMFKYVDRGIIFEDDDVPSQSFFTFCKELLDKYANDERINMISGMNHLGTYENGSDYLFTTNTSIWGWATWKRVVDNWDETYSFLDNKYQLEKIEQSFRNPKDFKRLFKTASRHKSMGKAFYESINESYSHLNSMLNIVPTKNMISNIGISENSTHASSNLRKYPKTIQKVFFMDTYDIDFPLRHPEYVIEDIEYKTRLDHIMGWNSIPQKIYRTIESKVRNIIYK